MPSSTPRRVADGHFLQKPAVVALVEHAVSLDKHVVVSADGLRIDNVLITAEDILADANGAIAKALVRLVQQSSDHAIPYVAPQDRGYTRLGYPPEYGSVQFGCAIAERCG